MRQITRHCQKSLRQPVGMFGTNRHRIAILVAAIALGLTLNTAYSQDKPETNPELPQATSTNSNDSDLSRDEILALFQREARAAYQMNKETCADLPAEQKKVCLARARLQFDADMRYAQKRADQGY